MSPSLSRSARKRTALKEAVNYRLGLSETDRSIHSFLKSIDSPRSLTVWLLYSNGEHDQLTQLSCDPLQYNCPFRFRDDYLASSFLSKANFLSTTFDRKEKALEKFRDSENLCRKTNDRFRNLALDPLFRGSNCWLLNATNRKIAQILGDYSAEEFVDSANWGPGVTLKLKGKRVNRVNKFHSENGITSRLHSLIAPVFSLAYPLWDQHLSFLYGKDRWDLQEGNAVTTVPKNSKTDRVIAIEPGINLWFQKAIGSMIRRRLRRCGLDLNTQEVNQSKSRSLDRATVDFSSASDTISTEVVKALLGPRWFLLLNCVRCDQGLVGSQPILWEKFSSMGNGFTFELETLIFYAAALAVCEYLSIESDVTVFGDDVIIPAAAYSLYSSFCEFLGFKVNSQKSFSTGYFRESCGAHWFDGVDVKPIFLKERLKHVESIFKLANNIRYLAHRRNGYYGCDAKFRDVVRRLVCRVPAVLRHRIPVGYGEGGFISNFDEARPSKARGGIEGFRFDCFSTVGLTDSLDSPAVLLARLWSSHADSAYGNTYTLRGSTKRQFCTTLAPQWYDLGPWL